MKNTLGAFYYIMLIICYMHLDALGGMLFYDNFVVLLVDFVHVLAWKQTFVSV